MPSSSVLETAGAPARANVKNVKRRAGRACATCHRRKVRCDLLTSGVPCTNCRIDGEACQLRPRQKKRTGRTVAGNSNAKHPEDGAGAVLESTSAQFLNEVSHCGLKPLSGLICSSKRAFPMEAELLAPLLKPPTYLNLNIIHWLPLLIGPA